jgi:hypothetical protein
MEPNCWYMAIIHNPLSLACTVTAGATHPWCHCASRNQNLEHTNFRWNKLAEHDNSQLKMHKKCGNMV